MSGTGRAAVDRLMREIGAASWFAALGERLVPSEIADAQAWLVGLGFAGFPVAAVGSFAEAERSLRLPAGEADWWAREETLRRQLLGDGADGLVAAASEATLAASAIAHGEAAAAAARLGGADPALIKVAAGAATQAAYHRALADFAADREARAEPFRAKFRLFAAGRWPLGIVQGAFRLF